jgi:hypothetical protein
MHSGKWAKHMPSCHWLGHKDWQTEIFIFSSLLPHWEKIYILIIRWRDDKPPLPFFFFLNWKWYNGYNRINCLESNGVRLSTPLLSALFSCQIHPIGIVTWFSDLLIVSQSLERFLNFLTSVFTPHTHTHTHTTHNTHQKEIKVGFH